MRRLWAVLLLPVVLGGCVAGSGRSPGADASGTGDLSASTVPPAVSSAASSAAGESSAPAADSAAPSTFPPPVPTSAGGRHVDTVSEAIAERDAGRLKASTIALGGYWTARLIGMSCPAPQATPGDLELYCHDAMAGITERYEAIVNVVRDATSMSSSGPKGPYLAPWIPPSLQERLLGLPTFGDLGYPPVPIVVIGHFDDPRAADCQPEARQRCRDRFVIESIAVFDPESVPPPTPTPPPTPFPSPAPSGLFGTDRCSGDVPYSLIGWTTTAELNSSADHSGHVWAMVTRDAVPTGIWGEDPNTPGHFDLPWGRRVCIGLESQPGGTEFSVINGTGFREWDDGRRTRDDSFGPNSGDPSLPAAGKPPAFPPPITAAMHGKGLAAAAMTIRDWSGELVAARPATDAELASASALRESAGAMILPSDARSVLILWAECGSDVSGTVIVTAERTTVLVHGSPRMDCVDPGGRRAMILTFSSDVPRDVTAVAGL